MHSEEVEQKKLKALLTELANIRGRHTELVTVYVPAGFNLNKVSDQIRTEISTAENIKSKTTKNNVTDALDKVLSHLKNYRETPKNGLAIFCGNISKYEGAADIELWAIEPPEPITVRLYRCDQVFILEPLQDLFREKEVYGFILVDRGEADIGLLKGKKIEPLKHLESIVPGKTSKGGWSQARYARVREGLLNDFLKEVGELANSKFKDLKDLKGIIIGGPGPTKNEFAEGDFLLYNLKNKVLGIVDLSYTGEMGLREAVERSQDILKEASVSEEKKLLDKFFEELSKVSGLAIYGLKETVQALENGNVDLLLLTDSIDWVRVEYSCPSCPEKTVKTIDRNLLENQSCSKCNSKLKIVKQEEMTEKIIELAEKMGTKVEMISAESQHGSQFKELGGIGGILRFRSS
ncbi:MAG TPA: peptide chain release factor aRF-1 [archaeon]|nr:peptide chain release factor aRF-1 [archaeon]